MYDQKRKFFLSIQPRNVGGYLIEYIFVELHKIKTMRVLFFVMAAIIFSGCIKKLEIYGNTFWTVKGQIVDTTNKPLSGVKVSILTTSYYRISPYGGANLGGSAISNTKITDNDGNFQMTFPGSNGEFHLLLHDSCRYNQFFRTYPWGSRLDNDTMMLLDSSMFNNYFADLKTVKIIKP